MMRTSTRYSKAVSASPASEAFKNTVARTFEPYHRAPAQQLVILNDKHDWPFAGVFELHPVRLPYPFARLYAGRLSARAARPS
jgi:hypothetical protein